MCMYIYRLNCISLSTVCKIFFCSGFPDILEKSWRRRRWRKLFKQTQQQVQVMQAFDFCLVNSNDEHTQSRFIAEYLFLIQNIMRDGFY